MRQSPKNLVLVSDIMRRRVLPFCFQTLLGGEQRANKNPRNSLSYRGYFWLRGHDTHHFVLQFRLSSRSPSKWLLL